MNVDLFDLERFVTAQDTYDSYNTALQEIKSGAKQSHWNWYIFPQQKGLGRSNKSEFYGLDGEEEAKAYLNHPVLGFRLREITNALLVHKGSRTIYQLMGSRIDVLKLKTSMMLFDKVSPNDVFATVLEEYFSNSNNKQNAL